MARDSTSQYLKVYDDGWTDSAATQNKKKLAEKKAAKVLESLDVKIGRILHPSPASPIANRGWAPAAEKQLLEMGVDLP